MISICVPSADQRLSIMHGSKKEPYLKKTFGFPVRRVLYRLTRGSGVAYHLIYFAVREGPDGAMVSILHVRRASRAPLSTDEAGEIKIQQ